MRTNESIKGMTMKNLMILCLVVTAMTAPCANAMETAMSSLMTSWVSGMTKDDKAHAFVKAKEDAYAFVASDGEIRGVQLEATLKELRALHPTLNSASDMEIALAIASY